MKHGFCILVTGILLFTITSIESAGDDFILLKNGSSYKGTIINYIPDKEVTIVTEKGKTHHHKISELARISINVKEINFADGISYQNTVAEIIPGLSVKVVDNGLPLEYAHNFEVKLETSVIEQQHEIEKPLPLEEYTVRNRNPMPEMRFAVSGFAGYFNPSFEKLNQGIEMVEKYYLDPDVEISGDDRVNGAMYYGLGFEMYLTPRLHSRFEMSYWQENLQAEAKDILNYGFKSGDYKIKGEMDISLSTFMFTLLYDLRNNTGGLQPYLGMGIGLNHTAIEYKTNIIVPAAISESVDLNFYEPDEKFSTNDILFQFVGGVDYSLTNSFGIRAEARYMVGDYDLDLENAPYHVKDKVNGYAVQLGLFYRF